MICPECGGGLTVTVGEERDGYAVVAVCDTCGHVLVSEGWDELTQAFQAMEATIRKLREAASA